MEFGCVCVCDPGHWKNKDLFSCWERSLQDRMRELPTSKHNPLTSDGSKWRRWMLGPNHRGRLQTLPIAPDPWMSGQDADGCLFSFCFFLVRPEQMQIFRHQRVTSAALWWSHTMLRYVMVQHVLHLQEYKQLLRKQQVDDKSSKSSRFWETPR